jgi:4-amino-4-deoxy-L-arabinose transferase-like glycosyltransferase
MSEAVTASEPTKFNWRSCLLRFLLFFAVVVMIQSFAGAYRSEFGSEPDEAAHYVTGLMIRDYVAHGVPGNPMHFAKDYYEHYPKVALGHWPPMFYVIQSVWTLIFSPSRISIMLLMAVLTAGAAMILFDFLRVKFGVWKGLAGTLLFLYVPMVQQFSSAVMTEIPMTFLLLIASIYWARFLESGRVKHSILFGSVAAIAILVKFSGFSLALVPLFSLLLTRRFSLLKTRAFWASAIVVVVIAGPWTIATLKIAREGMAGESVGWSFTHVAIPYYAGKLAQMCGFTVLLASLIGLAFTLARRSMMTSADAALAALFLSIVVFHMIVPTGFEARHLIPVVPALIYFAWTGADWVATQLTSPRLSLLKTSAIVFSFIAVVFGLTVFYIPRKGYAGFRPVADALNKVSQPHSTLLVASDARGEGMFISEVALREKRPGHFVQRASKKLAASTWEGGAYHLTYCKKMADKSGTEYSTPDQLATLLKNDSIDYVVFDESVPKDYRTKHLELLRLALDEHPADFHLIQSFDILRANTLHTNALRIYHIDSK